MRLKSFLLSFCLLLFLISSHAQSNHVKTLLDKVNNAVNTWNDGKYKMYNTYVKTVVGEDTTKRNNYYDVAFKKNPNDSLVGYKLSSFRNDKYIKIYNGNELFEVYEETLEITNTEKYPDEIKRLLGDQFIYPYFKYLNSQLQLFNRDSLYNKFKIIGKVNYHGENCYKVEAGTPSNAEVYFFVSIATSIPIGQYVRFEKIIGNAKEIQEFDYWISDLKEETIRDEKFEKQVLTGYKKEKNFNYLSEQGNQTLLKIGSKAPDWGLPLIGGGSIKMSDLVGKVVVLDFWYKACAPCQQQMIELQKLHDKFDKSKVVFIGVNTLDDPIKDKLTIFLSKRNIATKSVYKGKSIENLYQVYASPALFVIDKVGKVIFTIDGYSDTLLNDVSTIISKNM